VGGECHFLNILSVCMKWQLIVLHSHAHIISALTEQCCIAMLILLVQLLNITPTNKQPMLIHCINPPSWVVSVTPWTS